MDKTIANAVLQRAKGFCERCGVPSHDLALHHRKLKSRGGKDEVSNLVAICHKCHNMSTESIHLNPAKATIKGWMVPSWAEPSDYPIHLADGSIVRLDNDGNYKEVMEWQE
jgi:5-methylcytosine-specific restriction endonuclease McrA